MERVITYTVDNPLPRQKVRGFLKLKHYSTHSLKRLRDQPESILVNGEPVFLNHMLRPGDVITVRIREEASSDQILPVCLPVDILYEDEDLMIINKAAGMPVHPSQNNRDNTLGNALAWYFRQRNQSFVYRCVNRLDRDTSGLTIVAKHMVSGGILAAMTAEKTLRENRTVTGDRENDAGGQAAAMKKRGGGSRETGTGEERILSVRREYLAIVEGEMPLGEGTIDAPIGRVEGSCLMRRVDEENGERAVTRYRVLGTGGGCSLVSLELLTGRTHQIRVHMTHLGFPLIGDYLYNPKNTRMNRQALHACRLRFCHPMTGEPMDFLAPPPEDMRRALEELGIDILPKLCNTNPTEGNMIGR